MRRREENKALLMARREEARNTPPKPRIRPVKPPKPPRIAKRRGRPPGPPKPVVVKEPRHPKYEFNPLMDHVLRSCEGVVKTACELLELPRHAVRNRMRELGIETANPGGHRFQRQYIPTPEIDDIMRKYPHRISRIMAMTNWSMDAVIRRTAELGIPPEEKVTEDEIVSLLKTHQGCVGDVYKAIKASKRRISEKTISVVRERHQIPLTKPHHRGHTKNPTVALDKYIASLMRMTAVNRGRYLRSLRATLPDKIPVQRISAIMNVSIKTISNYRSQGWLSLEKNEFVDFIVAQCDFASMSEMPTGDSKKAKAASA